MVTEEYDTTLYEPGLIFKNEEEKSKIERGVAWLLRKLGSNIISIYYEYFSSCVLI